MISFLTGTRGGSQSLPRPLQLFSTQRVARLHELFTADLAARVALLQDLLRVEKTWVSPQTTSTITPIQNSAITSIPSQPKPAIAVYPPIMLVPLSLVLMRLCAPLI